MTNVIPEVLDENQPYDPGFRQSQTIQAQVTTLNNTIDSGARDERQNRQSANSIRKAG